MVEGSVTTTSIDPAIVLRLRAAVGRFGEMDQAGWWNTQGVLGSRGEAVYRRGLPRTHFFARVRVVTAVARTRSEQVYPAPGVATLWSLPAELERELVFAERDWLQDEGAMEEWSSFARSLDEAPADGLIGWLNDLELLREADADAVDALELQPGGKGVEVRGPWSPTAVEFLAAAHAKGSERDLVVPFVPGGLEAVE